MTDKQGGAGAPGADAAGAAQTVADAMRSGVISCPPETPLRRVAQMMAAEGIHCIVVTGEHDWGVVSDLDLMKAADVDLDATSAGETAASDLPTLSPGESLARAAQVMAEHEVTHVLVVDAAAGEPLGVLSSLDLARVLGG